MKVSEETSQKIKNMSIICAMLVVIHHIYYALPAPRLLNELIRNGVALIAVPFFFVVSGFFLSKHMADQNWYGKEIKKRIYSLVVPFVAWIAISIILDAPLSIISDILAHRTFGYSLPFSNGRWAGTLGIDPRRAPNYLGGLWYVRCLFCFVLFAPLFKWLLTKGRFIWLSCAFALTLIHSSMTLFPLGLQQCFAWGFSLSGLFYFSVGIHIGLSKTTELSNRTTILCSLVGWSLLVAKTIFSLYGIEPHINLMTIAIPFLLCSVWCFTPTSKWSNALTSCSFPLFLIHMPLIPYFSIPLKHSRLCNSLIGSALAFLGVALISFCITIILRKFFPRTNTFLFAGRS